MILGRYRRYLSGADGSLWLIQPEDPVGEEWAEWCRMTPAQRWLESERLWEAFSHFLTFSPSHFHPFALSHFQPSNRRHPLLSADVPTPATAFLFRVFSLRLFD